MPRDVCPWSGSSLWPPDPARRSQLCEAWIRRVLGRKEGAPEPRCLGPEEGSARSLTALKAFLFACFCSSKHLFLYIEMMLQTSPRTSSPAVHELVRGTNGTRWQRRWKVYTSREPGSLFTVSRMKTNARKHPHSKSRMCSAVLSTNAAALLL